MRHINIPIFIPHLGCPNQCIFCNQKFISGKDSFDEFSIKDTINQVLATKKSEDCCEIAFFGGSFTGIDRDLMIRLLELAQFYVDKGDVCGIRMSTRPDYISREIVDILKKYTVTYVELGVQSMNDKVLAYLKRGHTVQDTENAIRLLNEAGIPFIGQMMIGLPTATLADEIECAELICQNGASGSRIYPTIVLKNTELAHITVQGNYCPLELEEAIERSSKVLSVFIKNKVPCIRIGLCDSENLHSEETYLSGPNNPAIGEMIKSRFFYNKITEKICEDNFFPNKNLVIYCPLGKISQIIGNKKENIVKLKNRYGFSSIKVVENASLGEYEIILKEKEETICD